MQFFMGILSLAAIFHFYTIHIQYATVVVCQRRRLLKPWKWYSYYLHPGRRFIIPLIEHVAKHPQILHTTPTTLKGIKTRFIHESGLALRIDLELDYYVPNPYARKHIIDTPLYDMLEQSITKSLTNTTPVESMVSFIEHNLSSKLKTILPVQLISFGKIRVTSMKIKNHDMNDAGQRDQIVGYYRRFPLGSKKKRVTAKAEEITTEEVA